MEQRIVEDRGDREAPPARIVADGPERLRDVWIRQVRAEVEARYAAQLDTASGWRRILTIWMIEREIRWRTREKALPDALY